MQKKPMDYEAELDLKDLFFHVLYRWRSCLVAALIGALLLGSFQYFKLESIHREGKLTDEEKQYEVDLLSYENNLKNARKNYSNYEKLIKEQEEYENNSVWMKLDPGNVWIAERTYQVTLDQDYLMSLPTINASDPADNVLAVYEASVLSDVSSDRMQELFGTSQKHYLSELITVKADKEVNTFSISIEAASMEQANNAIQYFDDRIQNYCKEKANLTGSHTLTQISGDIFATTDEKLNQKQKEVSDKIASYEDNLKENKILLNELEDENAAPKEPGKHVIRFAVIGALLGGLLLVAIYFVQYFSSGCLNTEKDLSECYDILVYGNFYRTRARRPGKGIDKFIERWEKGKGCPSEETEYENICALLVENTISDEILLTGTIKAEELLIMIEKIKEAGLDKKLLYQADFVHNTTAINATKEAKEIIWVEKKHESSLKEIERVAEVFCINEANVIGCILL